MRYALAVLLAFFLAAVSSAREPPRKGLTVHEWGVWRVHTDLDLANGDMKAVWDGLPKFVYGQVTGRELPKHWPNIEAVDKPAVFFYAPNPVEVDFHVDFPGGFPGVWWPGTWEPSNRVAFGKLPPMPQPVPLARSLQWKLSLQQPPPGRPPRALTPVDRGHWVETLRAVGGDDVFSHVGEDRFGCEREKFIYYDGLLPRGDWVTPTVEKGRVLLTSKATHPLFDITVIDRRDSRQLRVARLEKLDAGARGVALELTDADGAKWPAQAEARLVEQLTDAGLFGAESKALVELWKQDLLYAGGVTVFYRLPQEEYERRLPLTMTPKPSQLVRVGLVVHPYCEPDLAERVARIVKDLDSDEFEVRERAQRELEGLGRAAYVHLVRLRRESKEAEVRTRIDRVLEKWDAGRMLPK